MTATRLLRTGAARRQPSCFWPSPAAAPAPCSRRGQHARYLRRDVSSSAPFFLITAQRFRAEETFKAVFGRRVGPFWGGGVEVALARTACSSRCDRLASSRTGERAFMFDGEESSGSGIPLTVDDHADRSHRRLALPTACWPRSCPTSAPASARTATRRRRTSSRHGDDVSQRTGYHVVGGAEVPTGALRSA